MPVELVANGLYIILSARSMPDSWHWGLYLHVHKDVGGWKTHINNVTGPWKNESKYSTQVPHSLVIVTFLQIGTIYPQQHATFVTYTPTLVPLRQGDPNFDCRVWVLETIYALAQRRYITISNFAGLDSEAMQLAANATPNVVIGRSSATVAVSQFSA